MEKKNPKKLPPLENQRKPLGELLKIKTHHSNSQEIK